MYPTKLTAMVSSVVPEEDFWTHNILSEFTDVVRSLDAKTLDVLYINPACEKLYHRSTSEFYRHPQLWVDLIHPSSRQEITKIFTTITQIPTLPGKTQEIEYWIVRSKGEIRLVKEKIWIVFDRKGHPIRIDSIITDITGETQEFKSAESLNLLEKNLRTVNLIQALPDSLFRLNNQGVYLDYLPSEENRLNPPTENIIGQNITELLEPELAEMLRHYMEVAARTKKVQIFEYQQTTEEGIKRDFEARITTIDKGDEFLVIARDITDQKETEAALRRSERRFRAIFNSTFQFMVVLQPDGKVQEANQTSLDFFGLEETDIKEKLFTELPGFYASSQRLVKEAINRAVKGEFVRCQIKIQGKNNEIATLDFSLKPVIDSCQKVTLLIGEGRDITELDEAREALKINEERLNLALLASDNGLWDWNITTGELYLSPRWESILGYANNELKRHVSTWQFLIHPEDMPNVNEVLQRHLADGLPYAVDHRLKTKLGDWKWILTQGEVVEWGEDGQPVRMIGTIKDITDRKLSEKALRESEAQYRQLAEKEALLNRIGSVIRKSLDLDKILERSVQEIYRQLPIDLCTFSWYIGDSNLPYWEVVKEAKKSYLPSKLGTYLDGIYKPISSITIRGEICQVDDVNELENSSIKSLLLGEGIASFLAIPIQTRSGKIGVLNCHRIEKPQKWSNAELELLKAVGDQLVIALNQGELYQQSRDSARIATAKSIELEQTLRQLQQTQANLIQAEKMSSLGQTVAGVAHEINNPVNFIYGNLSYADNYAQDLLSLIKMYQSFYPNHPAEIEAEIERIELDYLQDDFPKLLRSMKVGAERIREIVTSLRTFSRLDEAEMKKIDLHENIDSTLMILQNRLRPKSDRCAIKVIKDYGKLPLIDCYAGQLNQVFMNMISNAIDAIEDREKKDLIANKPKRESYIRISTAVIEDLVQISITDSGIGMHKSVIDRIFDPFYTTKPVGSGTGLGLSISYQIIVEKHRGNLQCFSELDKGTEFVIEIPLHPKY